MFFFFFWKGFNTVNHLMSWNYKVSTKQYDICAFTSSLFSRNWRKIWNKFLDSFRPCTQILHYNLFPWSHVNKHTSEAALPQKATAQPAVILWRNFNRGFLTIFSHTDLLLSLSCHVSNPPKTRLWIGGRLAEMKPSCGDNPPTPLKGSAPSASHYEGGRWRMHSGDVAWKLNSTRLFLI